MYVDIIYSIYTYIYIYIYTYIYIYIYIYTYIYIYIYMTEYFCEEKAPSEIFEIINMLL